MITQRSHQHFQKTRNAGIYQPEAYIIPRILIRSGSDQDRAQHYGVSLNDVLLTGPDLNNSLIGVLIRFRKELVAIIADVQQMFHCFVVREDHRDYLRFLWHRDNDSSKDLIEYRMKVHVFGNSPSPAVATYGLRQAARDCEQEYGAAAGHFIERNCVWMMGSPQCPQKPKPFTSFRVHRPCYLSPI